MKSVILIFLLCFSAFLANAQSVIGGSFAVDYNLLSIVKSEFSPDSIKSVAQNYNPIRNGGISVGIPLNIRLHRFALFRPQAVFNFMLNQVDFGTGSTAATSIRIQNINVEFPLQMMFTDLNKNKGIAGIFGIRGGHRIQEVQPDNTKFLNMKTNYAFLDVGMGYRVRIAKKTMIMPELRCSLGLNSILESGGTPYNLAIERMKQNRISLVLNFM